VVSSTSQVEQELARVLQSRWLRDSQQLSSFLKHVVTETLAGRTAGLKEYSLGLAVFHRPPSYDPRSDAIVRVQASLLRKRLASFYDNEGRDSPVRIEIPRGGYIARFAEPETPPAEQPKPRLLWPYYCVAMLVVGLLLGSLLAQRSSVPVAEGQILWRPFMAKGVESISSFGVPLFYIASRGLYVRDVHVNSPEDEPVSRLPELSRKLSLQLHPQEDVYTGIGDAIGTHLVARWLETHGVVNSVANSNYIGPSDVRGKNLVVVASQRFQTLLQKSTLPHYYRFVPDTTRGSYTVANPIPGEPSRYEPNPGKGVDVDYALVSLWPGETQGTVILHLSGTHTWSTQAAAQFVTDPEKLRALEDRMAQDPAEGPRGAKSPYFQLLLQVEGKNNRLRSVRYQSHHYLAAK
jgi:hypothetical protein